MKSEEVLRVLKKAGAIVTDSHLVYKSGRHGAKYINKDAIYPFTQDIAKICWMMCVECASWDMHTIVGPEKGGIILSQWTAHHLSSILVNPVHAVFAEKGPGETFLFKRGYSSYVAARRVVIVEDILTTGSSVKQVIQAVRETGGEVIGVVAMVNRGGVTREDLDVPNFKSLVTLDFKSYAEEDCPLCRDGVPINTELGHGAAYLAAKAETS